MTILPTPGRSDRPDREGVRAGRMGEFALALSVGMLEVGRIEGLTSSLPWLFGLTSPVVYALIKPGEFSFRNPEGSLARSGSLVGEPYLPLPPRDDPGVVGAGEFGKDLSRLALVEGFVLRTEGGDIGCESSCRSSSFRSESELRLFFFGGPVGMKLGCSPIVESPSDGLEVEPGDVASSSKP